MAEPKLQEIKKNTKPLEVRSQEFIHYVKHNSNMFRAGCISEHLASWESIISDHEILSTVRGLPIDFQIAPAEHHEHVPKTNVSTAESPIVDEEISNMMKKRVITESQYITGQHVSLIFLKVNLH